MAAAAIDPTDVWLEEIMNAVSSPGNGSVRRTVSIDDPSGADDNLDPPTTPIRGGDNDNAVEEQDETLPPLPLVVDALSPPRQLYDSSNENLVETDVLLEIIQRADLKKKDSIIKDIISRVTPDLRTRLLPKPPNHILAHESWKETIISIVLFSRLPVAEQKREVQKAKTYTNSEAKKHRKIIKALVEHRDINFCYNNGYGARSSAVSRSHATRRRERDSNQNQEDEAQSAPEEEEPVNHVGLTSSQAARESLLAEMDKPKYKRRKLGEAPTSVAAQSDVVAQYAADRAFATVARAIDTSECLTRAAQEPGNHFMLIQLNQVQDTNPQGGRPAKDCHATKPKLTVLSSSRAAARECLMAYKDVHLRNASSPHNYISEFIEREGDRSMSFTVVAHNLRNRTTNRAGAARNRVNVHSDITPSHPRYSVLNLTPQTA